MGQSIPTVHRIDQHQPLAHAALAHHLRDLPRNVHKLHPRRQIERQVFGLGYHVIELADLYPAFYVGIARASALFSPQNTLNWTIRY
jgi:hypothetical protein